MIRSARMIVAGLGLLLCAGYHLPSAHAASSGQRACRPWNHGAAARRHGWKLTALEGAQRWATLSFYDHSAGPRANPKSDKVVVAFHPQVPVLRVVILRGNCIVDIGQMDADALETILRDDGTPV
jgi:hypothetical protein